MKKVNLDRLRTELPILDVAQALGMDMRRNGTTYALWDIEKREASSLVLLQRSNRWKRYSSDEGGSTIDLVMYQNQIDFKSAVEWLTSSFPQYT